MKTQKHRDEIAAGEEDYSERLFEDPHVKCKACDNDMTAETHEDKHQICEYCRDYAREHDNQTVEELMDDLNIER